MSAKTTLKQISELADVSIATVSRVVNGHGGVSHDIRERVEQVIKETGYRPNPAARSLAGWKTRIIGLIIPESTTSLFVDPYYTALIPDISQACAEGGYTLSLFLFHSVKEEAKVITRVLSRQVLDGVILTGTLHDDPAVAQLIDSNTPFVMVGSHEEPSVSYIDSDNLSGAIMGVSHLLNLGYQRVAMISGPQTNLAAVKRILGYQKALQQHGRPFDPSLVVESDFTEAGGYNGIVTLLEQRPDAVFVASDRMAEGALRAIRHHGLSVPDDIAIVGFDDLPSSAFTNPPLTTVRQPIGQTGRLAVKTLLRRLTESDDKVQRVILPTELVIRSSCGHTRYQREMAG